MDLGYVDSMSYLSSLTMLILLLNQLIGRKEGPLETEESYQLNNTIITYINSYLLFYDNTKSTWGMWIVSCL